MNDIETLMWWTNVQHAARAKLAATSCPIEREALHAIAVVTSSAIVRLGRRQAASARATLARLDAEEACS